MEKATTKKLRIDKTNWTSVKFGDVAFEPKENARDIYNEGIEHVVGLEHIDSENIHLTRSGKLEETTTFTKKFRKGDVLFGRRRAYLKKAAVANFDGICSGDITVFRAKKNLLPELLPFIVNNDKFFDYAVKHSAGGLSPRVKFKDLANYEFLLPPKDHQAQLAELLWAMDEVIEKEREVLEKLNRLFSTSTNQFMIHGLYTEIGKLVTTKCGLLDSRITTIELKKCLKEKPTYGANAPSKSFINGSPRYIRITDIDDEGNLIDENKVTIDLSDYSTFLLEDLDFLFARTGNTVGKTFLFKSKMANAVFAGYLIRFRVDIKILRPEFLFYYTKSLKFETFKRKMIKVGAQPNLNSEEYQSMVLPLFPVQVQDQIIGKLDNIKLNIDRVKSKNINSLALQKSLINQIF
jgi:restriction endonuclease S subunit